MADDNQAPRYVAYLRVSTKKQGDSGLGIDGQRRDVTSFLGRVPGAVLLREYVEVESGKKNDRPKLREALEYCKVMKATLVIAKLDRLSRNAHFLTGLAERRVPFVACDMPEANELVVGMMALIAQHEVKLISERTKKTLAEAKARGTKLGNPNGAAHLRGRGNKETAEAARLRGAETAETYRGIFGELRSAGHTSLAAMAKELDRQQVPTPRGGKWHPMAVSRLMDRLAAVGQ